MIRFFFETGKSPDEDCVIRAMDTIATYCKQHGCENCPMEVNCSHKLEPGEWQIPASID